MKTKIILDEILIKCKRCFKDLPMESYNYHSGGKLRGNCRLCCNEQKKLNRTYNSLTAEQRLDKCRYNQIRQKFRRTSRDLRSKVILEDTRKSDKIKLRPNDLDLQFIESMISKGCLYCGNTELKMTLDRIDNSGGHTKNNVVPACCRCNLIRGSMPYNAWLQIAPAVKKTFDDGLFGDWVPGPWHKSK